VEYFKEKKILYKIIPGGYINGESLPHHHQEKKSSGAIEHIKCGHIWIPRVYPIPDSCPKCKEYLGVRRVDT
jgi:hypothetical protein